MAEIETWRPIDGYDGLYEVSDWGRVRSVARRVIYSDGRKYEYPITILALCNRGKYKGVTLSKNAKTRSFDVHRLVAKAFCDGTGAQVNHIDKNTHNNNSTNLEWCSAAENVRHSVSKILPRDVAFIRCVDKSVLPLLAGQMGISCVTAKNIHRGMNWKDINPKMK